MQSEHCFTAISPKWVPKQNAYAYVLFFPLNNGYIYIYMVNNWGSSIEYFKMTSNPGAGIFSLHSGGASQRYVGLRGLGFRVLGFRVYGKNFLGVGSTELENVLYTD